MKTITSRRHPVKFYLVIFSTSLLFSLMSAGILFLVITDINSSDETYLFGISCSFLLLLLAFYGLITYYINAPIIRISKDIITFNRRQYLIDDIDEIVFTGKHPFKHHPSFDLEGAKVVFKNGETRYIFDKMYANTPQLKCYLEQLYKKTPSLLFNKKPIINENEAPVVLFKGHPLFSSKSFWLLFSTAGLIILPLLVSSIYLFLYLLVIYLPAYIIFSYQLHYISVSGKSIIIKNFARPWLRIAHRLDTIKEVVIEQPNELTLSIRIILNSYETKLYPAGSLSSKDWKNLIMILKEKGLNVRNEYRLL